MLNISVFNIRAKVLNSLQDLQLNERERQTEREKEREFQKAGALTLKALADNANDCLEVMDKEKWNKCASHTMKVQGKIHLIQSSSVLRSNIV